MLFKFIFVAGIYLFSIKWINELFNLTKPKMIELEISKELELTHVPTKYYLGIGLASVNPKFYNGWAGKLGGTIPDIKLFEKQLSLRGFKTELVETENATYKNVLAKLDEYSNKAQAGDTVCIVYSGHGGNMFDDSGDESDGMDETWILWDRELRDDDIWLALKKFKQGVKVLLFSDSCHSGTAYKNSGLTQRVRVDTSLKDDGTLNCHLKYFGGCLDPQTSADLGTNGLFTRTIWNTVYKVRKSTYDQFFNRLLLKMPKNQRPTYHNLGIQIDQFNKENMFS